MKFRSLLCSVALGLFAFGGIAAAQDKAEITGLKDWAGEYVSAQTFWTDARTEDFFKAVVEEGEKQGKPATVDQVKQKMSDMYHSDYQAAVVDENGITFESKDGKSVRVDYEFKGAVKDADGEDWYSFEAKGTPEDSQLTHLVLIPLHGDPQHFHFRYGEVSAEDLLTKPEYHGWWGTFVHKGLTYEKYMEKMKPATFVKYVL
ncbi:ZinT/AdcA family metal-binding protein [Jonquetella sp. BV3C21]|uniref:ZinT/AdcA family metal-binding protein n=1 Tax=Jonquetella sp. BV3C21 TaxID=1111126 RepID=UPI0003ADBA4C|nr:ZinT/AdcA family metal-binding protein [Jonquetella sp. BV3C21]ERL24093.1 YodA lipocalin-like domain protein [Jonquetella sp. BV3C21]